MGVPENSVKVVWKVMPFKVGSVIGFVAAGTLLFATVFMLMMPGVKVMFPPFGLKASLNVHPHTGPGVAPSMGPPVQGKHSERIVAVTHEGGVGGVGIGVGAGGVELGVEFDPQRPLAGPEVGEEKVGVAGPAPLKH